MLDKSNTLNLEQAKELKEPATRMGQLYDAMLVLQLMETLCVNSMTLSYVHCNPRQSDTARHDPEAYILLPETIRLDFELIKRRGGVNALQSVLVNNFNVDSKFFEDGTFEELEDIINDMFLYSHINNEVGAIDYDRARFGNKDCTELYRKQLRQEINETVTSLLPQMKALINIIV
ncbi:MAG: hypothetical protein CMF12_14885 [Idiomarina sp.]|uniref:hypothetical protein n=1 Tax=Idiomarina sp. TaxID=1874361 RepID=UPI000C69CF03|nr:hypothetical protein [Idiomarina sp.]MBT43793.1 hypothetical protein [Idiomarina sp.]